MKNENSNHNSHTSAESVNIRRKEGFILFYVMGTLALLSLATIISVNSARLESRTARNHYDSVRALYHAEAGVKLVKRTVENRLANGEQLSTILDTLSVKPPDGVNFDEITTFKEIIPDRMFSFESIGRSNEAKSSVVVQFRRRPLMNAGLFGDLKIETRPNVLIYGYDSRVFLTPEDDPDHWSNGGGSIGSNGIVDLGNGVYLDGTILLGESLDGLIAACSRCTHFVQVEVGQMESDPLGILNGGGMDSKIQEAQYNNNNSLVDGISGNKLIMANNTGDVTLKSGTYYLEEIYVGNHNTLFIDDSDGPVVVYLNGKFHMHSQADVQNDKPWSFQIYSNSSEEINMHPNRSLSAFIYAPDAKINLQPGNHVRGAFWGRLVNIQPGANSGSIWLDSSLAERMMMNNLETHAWYEQHGTFN